MATVTTMTQIGQFDLDGKLDLWKIGLFMPLEEPIMQVRLYFDFIKIIRQNATYKSKYRNNQHRKKAMSHQLTIVVNHITVKLFESGAIQCTGCRNKDDVMYVMEILRPKIDAIIRIPLPVEKRPLIDYIDEASTRIVLMKKSNQSAFFGSLSDWKVIFSDAGVIGLEKDKTTYLITQGAFVKDEGSFYEANKVLSHHGKHNSFATFSATTGLMNGIMLRDDKGATVRHIDQSEYAIYSEFYRAERGPKTQLITLLAKFAANNYKSCKYKTSIDYARYVLVNDTYRTVLINAQAKITNADCFSVLEEAVNRKGCEKDIDNDVTMISGITNHRSLIITVRYGDEDTYTIMCFPTSQKLLFFGGKGHVDPFLQRCERLYRYLNFQS